MFSNKIVSKNSVLSKTGSVFLSIYLVAISFAGVTIAPMVADAGASGFNSPSANGFPSNNWTNANNAYVSDNVYATETTEGDDHSYKSFGFTVPSGADIAGIEVKVEAKSSDASGCSAFVTLWSQSDLDWGTTKSVAVTGADATYTLGNDSDLWGNTWVGNDFNNTNFILNIDFNDTSSNTCSGILASDGVLDMNGDGTYGGSTDDGSLGGKNIIDGKVDWSGNGTVDNSDDSPANAFLGFTVINGAVDVNNSGSISSHDDGEITGVTFSVDQIQVKVHYAEPQIQITTINGQAVGGACTGSLIVTVAGDGASSAPPGDASQYRVQIDWGDAIVTNNLGTFTPNSGHVNFTYTYSSSHTYAAGGNYTIKARLYHQGAPGNDNQADAVATAVVCVTPVPTTGGLIVTKNTIGGNGTFSFTGGAGAFSITTSGNTGTKSISGLAAGTVSVTETVPSGWAKTADTCQNITITAGATSTCSITNTKAGVIEVKKVVSGGSAVASDFAITVKDGSNATVGTAAGSAAGTAYTVAPGTYTVNEPANAHYTPSYSGACSGSNSVSVSSGATSTCTITNTYHNAAPTADNQSISTNEDVAVSGTVTGADTDGDTFSFGFLTAPTHGTLTSPLNPTTGAFTYTPALNYFGSDSFTFNTTDGVGTSAAATVTITVNPVNDAPNAVDDSASVNEDSSTTTISVLPNDTDTEGDTLSITGVTNPGHGTVAINGSSVDYMPTPGYNGSDSFTYTISDGNGGTDTATVNVSVSNVNDAPVAVNDSYPATEDTQLVVAAPGVLSNDTDADGDTLSANLMSNVTHGTLVFNGETGGFTYDPDHNYCGPDSFTYKANDGTAQSNEATASIDVTCANDAPVAQNGSIDTDQNMATSSNLIATDTEGSALSYDVTVYPMHGWFTAFASSTGAFTYSPNFGFLGSDSFKFKANDGSVDSNEATVSINVHTVLENTFAKCTDTIDNDGDSVEGDNIDLDDSDCAQFLPVLVINKTSINGDGRFTFTVTGMKDSVVVGTEEGEGSSGNIVLNEGSYTVTELDSQAWRFTSAECTYDNAYEGDDSDAIGNVVGHSEVIEGLGAGDVVTCHFVNTKAPQCSDGIDNDDDGFTDFNQEGGDNNCLNADDNSEFQDGVDVCANLDGFQSEVPGGFVVSGNNCLDMSNTGGGGGGGGGSNGPISTIAPSNGQVLGASTSTLPAGCNALLNTYMRQYRKANDTTEVKELQQFLNTHMGANLPVTGFFGPMTDTAVRNFQAKYPNEVLTPWGLNGPTGFVFKTTQRWVNLMYCKDLNIPMPTDLTPYLGE